MDGATALAREIAAVILEDLRAKAPKKELYTINEAGELLGMSRRSVELLIADKRLPIVRIDTRPRIQRADMMRLIELSKD